MGTILQIEKISTKDLLINIFENITNCHLSSDSRLRNYVRVSQKRRQLFTKQYAEYQKLNLIIENSRFDVDPDIYNLVRKREKINKNIKPCVEFRSLDMYFFISLFIYLTFIPLAIFMEHPLAFLIAIIPFFSLFVKYYRIEKKTVIHSIISNYLKSIIVPQQEISIEEQRVRQKNEILTLLRELNFNQIIKIKDEAIKSISYAQLGDERNISLNMKDMTRCFAILYKCGKISFNGSKQKEISQFIASQFTIKNKYINQESLYKTLHDSLSISSKDLIETKNKNNSIKYILEQIENDVKSILNQF